MDVQQQAFEIAQRYLFGSEMERQAILSCFTEEEQEVFVRFVGFYRLYSDQKYYDSVKSAVCNQCRKEGANRDGYQIEHSADH